MKKKYTLMLVAALFSWVNTYSEEASAGAQEKKISYNVALDLGSTYLWRSYDVYANHSSSTSVFNFAPGLFPSVTLTTADGLSFNVWAAAALIDRVSAGNLKVYDEVDFTGSYSIQDKSGTFGASLIGYVYPTAGNNGASPSYGEMVFTYTAPVLLSPFASVAAALGPKGAEYEYASIGISHTIELGKVKFAPKLLAGYWIMNNNTKLNVLHFDINAPFSLAITDSLEVHVGLVGCYRVGNSTNPFIMTAALGTSYSF